VRTFPGKAMLEHSVRFTVGEASHTDQLLAALDALLA
jgi:histidinol-phosphate/aromatic aminotransferase/cobyric acid decarboxylase-like protein